MPYFGGKASRATLRGQPKCDNARLQFRKLDIARNTFFNKIRITIVVSLVAVKTARPLIK
jgi:hypothetical protein